MRYFIAILFSLLLATAHADAKDDAIRAAAEDCITTGAALSFGGLTEMSPVGPVLSCTLKPLVIGAIAAQPEPQRTEGLHAVRAVWAAAAVNNFAAIFWAGSVSPIFGVFVLAGLWASGEQEREFAQLCAVHRQLAGHDVTCNYTRS